MSIHPEPYLSVCPDPTPSAPATISFSIFCCDIGTGLNDFACKYCTSKYVNVLQGSSANVNFDIRVENYSSSPITATISSSNPLSWVSTIGTSSLTVPACTCFSGSLCSNCNASGNECMGKQKTGIMIAVPSNAPVGSYPISIQATVVIGTKTMISVSACIIVVGPPVVCDSSTCQMDTCCRNGACVPCAGMPCDINLVGCSGCNNMCCTGTPGNPIGICVSCLGRQCSSDTDCKSNCSSGFCCRSGVCTGCTDFTAVKIYDTGCGTTTQGTSVYPVRSAIGVTATSYTTSHLRWDFIHSYDNGSTVPSTDPYAYPGLCFEYNRGETVHSGTDNNPGFVRTLKVGVYGESFPYNLKSVSLYISSYSPGDSVRVAVYDDTGSIGGPGALLGESGPIILTSTGWVIFPFTSLIPVGGAIGRWNVHLAFQISSSSVVFGSTSPLTGYGYQYYRSFTYGPFPNPFGSYYISPSRVDEIYYTLGALDIYSVYETLAAGQTSTHYAYGNCIDCGYTAILSDGFGHSYDYACHGTCPVPVQINLTNLDSGRSYLFPCSKNMICQ